MRSGRRATMPSATPGPRPLRGGLATTMSDAVLRVREVGLAGMPSRPSDRTSRWSSSAVESGSVGGRSVRRPASASTDRDGFRAPRRARSRGEDDRPRRRDRPRTFRSAGTGPFDGPVRATVAISVGVDLQETRRPASVGTTPRRCVPLIHVLPSDGPRTSRSRRDGPAGPGSGPRRGQFGCARPTRAVARCASRLGKRSREVSRRATQHQVLRSTTGRPHRQPKRLGALVRISRRPSHPARDIKKSRSDVSRTRVGGVGLERAVARRR